jgi:hypothetical protein
VQIPATDNDKKVPANNQVVPPSFDLESVAPRQPVAVEVAAA